VEAGLAGIVGNRVNGATGSFPKAARGDVRDPFGRFVEIGIIVLDPPRESDGAWSAKLPKPLEGKQQHGRQFIRRRGIDLGGSHHVTPENAKARRGCAGLK
jgi:hypothetical protein